MKGTAEATGASAAEAAMTRTSRRETTGDSAAIGFRSRIEG